MAKRIKLAQIKQGKQGIINGQVETLKHDSEYTILKRKIGNIIAYNQPDDFFTAENLVCKPFILCIGDELHKKLSFTNKILSSEVYPLVKFTGPERSLEFFNSSPKNLANYGPHYQNEWIVLARDMDLLRFHGYISDPELIFKVDMFKKRLVDSFFTRIIFKNGRKMVKYPRILPFSYPGYVIPSFLDINLFWKFYACYPINWFAFLPRNTAIHRLVPIPKTKIQFKLDNVARKWCKRQFRPKNHILLKRFIRAFLICWVIIKFKSKNHHKRLLKEKKRKLIGLFMAIYWTKKLKRHLLIEHIIKQPNNTNLNLLVFKKRPW